MPIGVAQLAQASFQVGHTLLAALLPKPLVGGRSLGVVVQRQQPIEEPPVALFSRIQQGQLDGLAEQMRPAFFRPKRWRYTAASSLTATPSNTSGGNIASSVSASLRQPNRNTRCQAAANVHKEQPWRPIFQPVSSM